MGPVKADRPRRPVDDGDRTGPFADPLVLATIEVVVERGYLAAGWEEIAERAGPEEAGRAWRFAGKEDCVLWVLEELTRPLAQEIEIAFETCSDWRDALRAAGYTAARWMEDHPAAACFVLVEVLGARGRAVRARRQEFLERCAALIDCDPTAVGRRPTRRALVAFAVIVEALSARIAGGEPMRTEELVPELMYKTVRSYLGEDAAREELGLRPPTRLALARLTPA
jgi:AcrR family transcriptional regulator